MIPQPSPPHARAEGPPKTEPDGRWGADLCEPNQHSLQDMAKSARTGPSPSEGSREHTHEERIFEIGELEQGVLRPQPSTRSPEQRLVLRRSQSHPRASRRGVEKQADRHGSLERVSKHTSRNAESGDGQGAALEMMENPGYHRQSLPTSQPVTPSPTLPLHLIPLLPLKSPSSKRQGRSIGPLPNQVDKVADDFSGRGGLTGRTSPSTQKENLRGLRLQNCSAESAGISRTLAYAMDQMNATNFLPLRGAELEKLVMTREAEGDVATRSKTVRFEESTCHPAELAEHLWTDAVLAAATCGQGATIGEKIPEGDAHSFLRNLGAVTPGKAEERQSNKDAILGTDVKARCAAEGGSRTVEPEVGWRAEDAGSEAERAILASQTLKPAQLREYTRLKEREVELRNAEAEIRMLEERLEGREKDLRNRLETVRQSLEVIRQRRASVNRQKEILRQKLDAVTKEVQGSAPEVCHLHHVRHLITAHHVN